MNEYISVLKKYAVFTGRAGRREYWMFVLFNFIVSCVLFGIDTVSGIPILGFIYSLGVFLPGVAATVRRLHDTNRSWLWILVAIIPFVGCFVLLFFMIQEGTKGENQFGPKPINGLAMA